MYKQNPNINVAKTTIYQNMKMYQYINMSIFILIYESACLSQNSFKYQYLSKKYSISASFSLFKNTMSSKDTLYLITTLHHSFIESKLTYFKTKAV